MLLWRGKPDRRFYVDLGANTYDSSIATFRKTYPLGSSFHVVAFEVSRAFDSTYRAVDPSQLELHHYAAWTTNETLRFVQPSSNRGLCARMLQRNESVPCRKGKELVPVVRHAIDIADFL